MCKSELILHQPHIEDYVYSVMTSQNRISQIPWKVGINFGQMMQTESKLTLGGQLYSRTYRQCGFGCVQGWGWGYRQMEWNFGKGVNGSDK